MSRLSCPMEMGWDGIWNCSMAKMGMGFMFQMGLGMKSLKWEEFGTKNLLPHIYSLDWECCLPCVQSRGRWRVTPRACLTRRRRRRREVSMTHGTVRVPSSPWLRHWSPVSPRGLHGTAHVDTRHLRPLRCCTRPQFAVDCLHSPMLKPTGVGHLLWGKILGERFRPM